MASGSHGLRFQASHLGCNQCRICPINIHIPGIIWSRGERRGQLRSCRWMRMSVQGVAKAKKRGPKSPRTPGLTCMATTHFSQLSSWLMPSGSAGPSTELLGKASALLPGAVFPIISSAVLLSLLCSWVFLFVSKSQGTFPKCLAGSERPERTKLICGL